MSEDLLDEIEAAAEVVSEVDGAWWPTNDERTLAVSRTISVNAEDIAKRHGEKEDKVADMIKNKFWRI